MGVQLRPLERLLLFDGRVQLTHQPIKVAIKLVHRLQGHLLIQLGQHLIRLTLRNNLVKPLLGLLPDQTLLFTPVTGTDKVPLIEEGLPLPEHGKRVAIAYGDFFPLLYVVNRFYEEDAAVCAEERLVGVRLARVV